MPKKKPKKDWSSINSRIKNRKKKFKADERIFIPTFNKSNSSKVIMRFLDAPQLDLPYVETHSHFFKDIGGWMITNCPTTIDKKCPICEDIYVKDYYNTDNDLYYDRKKKTYYYTNVLIVDDVNNSENNGKVFLFKFGKKIMDKIDDAIEENKTPWDEDAGENFTFSAKKNGKMSSYDGSYFSDNPTELSEYGDVDTIIDTVYDLSAFISPSEYLEYDQIETKYNTVIANTSTDSSSEKPKRNRVVDETDDVDEVEIVEDVNDSDKTSMYDDSDDDDSFFDDLED